MLSLIAIVGDITPLDGVSKAEKNQREQEALDHMCKVLGGGSTGTFFHSVHGHCYWFLANYCHLMLVDFFLCNKLTPAILYHVVGTCDDHEPSFMGANEQ